jgi:hypothetical protein
VSNKAEAACRAALETAAPDDLARVHFEFGRMLDIATDKDPKNEGLLDLVKMEYKAAAAAGHDVAIRNFEEDFVGQASSGQQADLILEYFRRTMLRDAAPVADRLISGNGVFHSPAAATAILNDALSWGSAAAAARLAAIHEVGSVGPQDLPVALREAAIADRLFGDASEPQPPVDDELRQENRDRIARLTASLPPDVRSHELQAAAEFRPHPPVVPDIASALQDLIEQHGKAAGH